MQQAGKIPRGIIPRGTAPSGLVISSAMAAKQQRHPHWCVDSSRSSEARALPAFTATEGDENHCLMSSSHIKHKYVLAEVCKVLALLPLLRQLRMCCAAAVKMVKLLTVRSGAYLSYLTLSVFSLGFPSVLCREQESLTVSRQTSRKLGSHSGPTSLLRVFVNTALFCHTKTSGLLPVIRLFARNDFK